ncbi:MAG: dihydrodipicolinate synthase family protein [Candidatus Marinimicrobia bacterium]|nr:dihydrodipicolinate synthase family protein [Candidatus Neomarinimicrobiota bacterium]|tara:strand:+ start:1579 stop:2649 length:1071 start_codon:yes stop_codon:yes gene_type:complete
MNWLEKRDKCLSLLKEGLVIPAHPLALDKNGKLDERSQKAITRYYCEAGAGGVAVAVHSTQFEIRDAKIGLHRPVLELALEVVRNYENSDRSILKIAGVIGDTDQAVKEASLASELGYDLVLISLGALKGKTNKYLIKHLSLVSEVLPIMGFYLQPAVGGRELNFDFWRKAAELNNLVAIKIAAFNRYQTLDVIRAVAESNRSDNIALYTGNDDNIIIDLLCQYDLVKEPNANSLRFVGGLLGHWAFWTSKAVEQLEEIRKTNPVDSVIQSNLLSLAARVTDANAAVFDAANNFAGCIPGINEILRRQGLMQTNRTLRKDETLSEGQLENIDRIYSIYPELNDDEFVDENLDRWLT